MWIENGASYFLRKSDASGAWKDEGRSTSGSGLRQVNLGLSQGSVVYVSIWEALETRTECANPMPCLLRHTLSFAQMKFSAKKIEQQELYVPEVAMRRNRTSYATHLKPSGASTFRVCVSASVRSRAQTSSGSQKIEGRDTQDSKKVNVLWRSI